MQNPRDYAKSVAKVLRERLPDTLGKRLNDARLLALLTSGTNNTLFKDHSDAQR